MKKISESSRNTKHAFNTISNEKTGKLSYLNHFFPISTSKLSKQTYFRLSVEYYFEFKVLSKLQSSLFVYQIFTVAMVGSHLIVLVDQQTSLLLFSVYTFILSSSLSFACNQCVRNMTLFTLFMVTFSIMTFTVVS
jgi:hypothetical protein